MKVSLLPCLLFSMVTLQINHRIYLRHLSLLLVFVIFWSSFPFRLYLYIRSTLSHSFGARLSNRVIFL